MGWINPALPCTSSGRSGLLARSLPGAAARGVTAVLPIKLVRPGCSVEEVKRRQGAINSYQIRQAGYSPIAVFPLDDLHRPSLGTQPSRRKHG